MKRPTTLIAVGAATIGLAACGGSTSNAPKQPAKPINTNQIAQQCSTIVNLLGSGDVLSAIPASADLLTMAREVGSNDAGIVTNAYVALNDTVDTGIASADDRQAFSSLGTMCKGYGWNGA